MSRHVTLTRRADLIVRRRGLGALVRRALTGAWSTYQSSFLGTMVVEVPDGEPDPGVHVALNWRGRPVVWIDSDDVVIHSRYVKEDQIHEGQTIRRHRLARGSCLV